MKITEWIEHYRKANYFPVGEGWRSLVEKLVNDIAKIDPKVEVTQVKEKFGTLRFYISGGNDEVDNLIEKAERKSSTICEICGKKGKPRDLPWVLTLCADCYRRRYEKDPKI